jgi:hypothetical protein
MEQKEYLKYFLDNIDKNRTRLRNNITVICACDTSTLLCNYFKHCNSNKHLKYLKNTNSNFIYSIVDSKYGNAI